MDNLTAFLLDAIWIIGFCAVWIFGMVMRRDLRSNSLTALIVLVVFLVNHYASAQMLSGLKYSAQVGIQYHIWTTACLAIAGGVLIGHISFNLRMLWPAKCIVVLMCFEAFFNLAMHVDQNWIGLNDFGPANSSWRNDKWWLWTWYSAQSNIDNFLMVLAFLMPVSLRGKTAMDALKGWVKNVFALSFTQSNHKQRISTLEELAYSADPERQAYALSLLESARELLHREDETLQDHSPAITALLDAASYVCSADVLPHQKESRA